MTGKAGFTPRCLRKDTSFSFGLSSRGGLPVSHRDSQPGMPQNREGVWMVASQKNHSCPLLHSILGLSTIESGSEVHGRWDMLPAVTERSVPGSPWCVGCAVPARGSQPRTGCGVL